MKASLAISKYFHQNKIFDPGSRDNCNERFIELRELLSKQGIDLNTEDINPLSTASEIHIHVDADSKKLRKSKRSGAHIILIISESPIICTANQDERTRKLADKIFTWETNLSESNASWIGCGCSFEKQRSDERDKEAQRRKDLCMIIGNKSSQQDKELYSTRRAAIKYFENSTIGFDLYGTGWEKRSFSGALRPLNRINIIRNINYDIPQSYQGVANSKMKTLQCYRFSLAFENAKSHNGYISEKIFDAMISGTIPIYIGAENISDFLPDSTYINANKMSFQEIEQTIRKMTKTEYESRVESIREYTAIMTQTSFYYKHWAQTINKYISSKKGFTRIQSIRQDSKTD